MLYDSTLEKAFPLTENDTFIESELNNTTQLILLTCTYCMLSMTQKKSRGQAETMLKNKKHMT